MSTVHHIASEETLQSVNTTLGSMSSSANAKLDSIKSAIEDVVHALGYNPSGDTPPTYDPDTGQYVNLASWLAAQRNGKIYGVEIPKFNYTSGTSCIKVLANAGLHITPSTASYAGTDDYKDLLAFKAWDVNGGVNTDGTPYVTSFRDYDTSFENDGSNGNVWRMAPVLYWSFVDEGTHILLKITDTPQTGFSPQPGAKLPDGTLRPFMLYAKYAGGMYNSKYSSVSGIPVKTRDVSHDTLINLCENATTGYSGRSFVDDWYLKVMFLMKYATKNSQSIFAGCTDYNCQYSIAAGESNVKRVTISTANAANLIVGSSVCVDSGDRSGSICGNAKILSIAAKDSSNSYVNLDVSSNFTTTTSHKISTVPWHTGCLDMVQGTDGAITVEGLTNGKEPFLLQGIECSMGCTEILGDVILYSGNLGVDVYVNYDSKDEKTAYDSDVYTDTGVDLPVSGSAGWTYLCDVANAGGFLIGHNAGASTSTGLCDGHYQSGSGSNGWREFHGFGALHGAASAGLWCAASASALSIADWTIGSRLSGTGRTAA